jgi:hypothetical protein
VVFHHRAQGLGDRGVRGEGSLESQDGLGGELAGDNVIGGKSKEGKALLKRIRQIMNE